ncbi:ThuA domain-containing protein [Lentisphaera marina]|uniref:ThuA domain-containing protein n=1 Tax=Lentisphaera marina TaxID=1111041 RepID=UPI0023673BCB|nr:ThuA domain-containing protein [Lentisphaera marina]MDD7983775.1 ThuA domain-containing protein [Lentisphaera marina]
MKCLFQLITLMVLSCFFSCTSDKSQEKVQVLIVDGFSNHDWEKTTHLIQRLLQNEKDIDLTVSTIPMKESEAWKSWKPDFKKYTLVIQNTNDINNGSSWPLAAEKAFEKYMFEGGRMLVFHSANNAFPQWKAYNEMIGLGWRNKNFGKAIIVDGKQLTYIPKGEGENTGHGKRRDVLVHKFSSHPINRDYPQTWSAADLEVYRYARGPAKNLRVLSYGKDEKTGKDFPIDWLVKYGEGEIYNSTYGHYWHGLKQDPAGVRCVAFQTSFIRALRYLSNLELKEIPKDFPDSDSVKLRSLDELRKF